MNKPLTATLFCVKCDAERGRIYGVERGNGVLENVSDLADSTTCAVCGSKLLTSRPENGPLPKPKPKPKPVLDPVMAVLPKEIKP